MKPLTAGQFRKAHSYVEFDGDGRRIVSERVTTHAVAFDHYSQIHTMYGSLNKYRGELRCSDLKLVLTAIDVRLKMLGDLDIELYDDRIKSEHLVLDITDLRFIRSIIQLGEL